MARASRLDIKDVIIKDDPSIAECAACARGAGLHQRRGAELTAVCSGSVSTRLAGVGRPISRGWGTLENR